MTQGWSLKRIQHEAHRREWANYSDTSIYHPLRDGARQQDWEWVVDWLYRKDHITATQHTYAHRFYNAQQALAGDVAPDPKGMPLTVGETALERAARIYWGGHSYVMRHPDLTDMRQATFDCVFRTKQPTLETVRVHGRPNGGRGRMKQSEVIKRVKWCLEVLADHFNGTGYEEAAVNEKQMGVGEGWVRLDHVSAFPANYVETLQQRGYQVFMAPSGNVYARDPKIPSVFEPLDSTPQTKASKR